MALREDSISRHDRSNRVEMLEPPRAPHRRACEIKRKVEAAQHRGKPFGQIIGQR